MSTDRPDPTNESMTESMTESTTESTNAPETSTMAQYENTPSAPELSDPTAAPDETTTIPASPTLAIPTPAPYRVEPATPVPDDAVADTEAADHRSTVPHVPSPTGSAPDPAWPPPVVAHEAPRPALVTVRKGPRPGSIMFGLLTMIVSAYVLVANLTNADLSFRLVGPPMIGAFGGMLLIVGLAGVVAGRLRR